MIDAENLQALFTYSVARGHLKVRSLRSIRRYGDWAKKNHDRLYSYIDGRTPIDVFGEPWRIVDIIWTIVYGHPPTGISFNDGNPFNFKLSNLVEIECEAPYKLRHDQSFYQRENGGISARIKGRTIGVYKSIGIARRARNAEVKRLRRYE